MKPTTPLASVVPLNGFISVSRTGLRISFTDPDEEISANRVDVEAMTESKPSDVKLTFRLKTSELSDAFLRTIFLISVSVKPVFSVFEWKYNLTGAEVL